MKLSWCALSLLGTLASSAQAVADDALLVPGTFIVELASDQDASALYDELRSEGIAVSHRMDFKYKLFKGASFQVNGTADSDVMASKISSKGQVKGVWPVRKIQMPKVDPSSIARNGTSGASTRPIKGKRQDAVADTYSPHVMTQVDQLRAAGITGKGIRVAVVDTGIDYRHPALGGCFGEGCVVAYGYDLTGDNYNEGVAELQPDPDPLDTCQGHGSHVAGIIMAQQNELGFTGAAPDVTLGMYKVSGCPGYTTSEILVSAFNMAYEDGSDIISCSVGDDSGWATDAAAVAVSRIGEAGVAAVVALGNSGNLGVWQAASPASGIDVSGIGSVDNTVLPTLLTKGSYENSTGEFNFGWQEGSPIAPQNLSLPLWTPLNLTDPSSYGCDSIPEGIPDLNNTIALIPVPSCAADTQAEKIAAKGGKYILYYPQSTDRWYSMYVYTEGIEGVGLITPRQANEWIEALKSKENITVTMEPPSTAGQFVENFSNGARAGLASSFSSWGPTWELEIKPQFVTPGGGILSTWIWDQGAYAVNPGTSMATPLAAAIFALVRQVRGKIDVHALRNVIAATAQAKPWYDGTTLHNDILAPVAQQGAGLPQAYAAAHAVSIPSVSGISFNDTENFIGNHSFTLENTGTTDVTYTIGHAKAATVYTFTEGLPYLSVARTPTTADAWAELTFGSDKVTVPAGGSAEVQFTAVPPSDLNTTLLPVYSGYITLNGTNGENLSVPYLGVAGSMHDTPVIRAPVTGLDGAYLSSNSDHFLIPVPANRTFTIPRPGTTGSAIFPKIVVAPIVGTTEMHIELVAIGGANATLSGPIPGTPLHYVPTAGYTYNFGGYLADRTVVPEGSYKFVVTALRIFGDAANKDDWDIVETVPFNLRYLS